MKLFRKAIPTLRNIKTIGSSLLLFDGKKNELYQASLADVSAKLAEFAPPVEAGGEELAPPVGAGDVAEVPLPESEDVASMFGAAINAPAVDGAAAAVR